MNFLLPDPKGDDFVKECNTKNNVADGRPLASETWARRLGLGLGYFTP